jgi:hypothetical protein
MAEHSELTQVAIENAVLRNELASYQTFANIVLSHVKHHDIFGLEKLEEVKVENLQHLANVVHSLEYKNKKGP